MDHRAVARMLAAGRVAIGALAFAAPAVVGRLWVGDVARQPGAKLITRAFGVRDLVLGLGVLSALERGDERAVTWVQASALSDAGDTVATLAVYRHLPRRLRVGPLLTAASAAGLGFAASANLD